MACLILQSSYIFDGVAVVHFPSTASASTLAEYARKVFIPFLLQQLQEANMVDWVWDRCIPNRPKETAREHRKHGTWSEETKIPKK